MLSSLIELTKTIEELFIIPSQLHEVVTSHCSIGRPKTHDSESLPANLPVEFAFFVSIGGLFARCFYSCHRPLHCVVIHNGEGEHFPLPAGVGHWPFRETISDLWEHNGHPQTTCVSCCSKMQVGIHCYTKEVSLPNCSGAHGLLFWETCHA